MACPTSARSAVAIAAPSKVEVAATTQVAAAVAPAPSATSVAAASTPTKDATPARGKSIGDVFLRTEGLDLLSVDRGVPDGNPEGLKPQMWEPVTGLLAQPSTDSDPSNGPAPRILDNSKPFKPLVVSQNSVQ